MVTASVTTPDNGGQIHMVIDITQETPEPIRTRADLLPSVSGETPLPLSLLMTSLLVTGGLIL